MKKLTTLTLIFGTILLSGCGAQQKNISAENNNLSDKKVAVSSGEKVETKIKNKIENKKITNKVFLNCIDKGDINCVNQYVKQGGNLNGKTPLLHAIHGGHKEIVKLFIENGQVPDLQYRTGIEGLIRYAKKLGKNSIVKILEDYEKQKDKENIIVVEQLPIDGYGNIVRRYMKNVFKERYYAGYSSNDYVNNCYFLVYNTVKKDKNGEYKKVYKLYFNKGAEVKSSKLEGVEKIGVRWIHNGKKDDIYFLKSYNKKDGTFNYSISEIYNNLKESEKNNYEMIFYKKDGTEYKLKFNLDDLKDKNFDFEKKVKEIEKLDKIISDLKNGKYGGYMKDENTWCFIPKVNKYCINLGKAYYTGGVIEENKFSIGIKTSFNPNKNIIVNLHYSGISYDTKVYKIGKYFVERMMTWLMWAMPDELKYYYNYYDDKGNLITLKNNNILKNTISIGGLIYKLKKVGGHNNDPLTYQSVNTLKKLLHKFTVHEFKGDNYTYIPERLTLKNKDGFIGQYELYDKLYGGLTVPYIDDGFSPSYKGADNPYVQIGGYIILKGRYKEGLLNDLDTTRKITNLLMYSLKNKSTHKLIGTITKKDLPIFKIIKLKYNFYILGLSDKYELAPKDDY